MDFHSYESCADVFVVDQVFLFVCVIEKWQNVYDTGGGKLFVFYYNDDIVLIFFIFLHVCIVAK